MGGESEIPAKRWSNAVKKMGCRKTRVKRAGKTPFKKEEGRSEVGAEGRGPFATELPSRGNRAVLGHPNKTRKFVNGGFNKRKAAHERQRCFAKERRGIKKPRGGKVPEG